MLFIDASSLRHVMGEDHTKSPSSRDDVATADLDPEIAPVLAPMLSHSGVPRLDPGRPIPTELGNGFDILGRQDVPDRQLEKLLAGVAILSDGGIVDGHELQSLRIAQPHRKRVDLEERAVVLFSLAKTLLRDLALYELADPAAEVCERVHQLRVEGTALVPEELDHTEDPAAALNRKAARRVEAVVKGVRRPREVGIGDHVGDPCRLAARPHPARHSNA